MTGRPTYDAVVVGAGPTASQPPSNSPATGCSVAVLEAEETDRRRRPLRRADPPRLRPRPRLRHPPSGLRLAVFRSLPLEDHGLEWIHPPAPLAHPFDDGTAAMLERSTEEPGPPSDRTPKRTEDDGPPGRGRER